MCVGDGEAFQQLREGRIERGIRCARRALPRKRETKRVVVGRREICKRKREEGEGWKESRKSVKIEGKGRKRREGWGDPRGAGRV